MNNLKIVGVNLNIHWKDKASNFADIEKITENVAADLIMLPEMFSTGFCTDADEIADRNEETLKWMQTFAKNQNVAVCGSASIAENGNFYNRFYFVKSDGSFEFYDKRHLFRYSGEDKIYKSGDERVIVNFEGWRIFLQVCYDLRFPVFARNNGDYDAILYVANWPETRIDAWNTLLKARAIENQSYVFGLNRIGTDGNNLTYPESSSCFFADGTVISEVHGNLVIAEFDEKKLSQYREKFQFLGDRDSFKIL